jgi:hypothetical protein
VFSNLGLVAGGRGVAELVLNGSAGNDVLDAHSMPLGSPIHVTLMGRSVIDTMLVPGRQDITPDATDLVDLTVGSGVVLAAGMAPESYEQDLAVWITSAAAYA